MPDSIFCSQCGTALDAQARFCSKCGNITASVAAPAPSQPAAMTATATAMAPQTYQPMPMSPVPPAMPPQYGDVSPGCVQPAALPYAGFWMRVGAYFVDLVVLFIPLFILTLIPILGFITNIVGIW